MGKRLFGTDGIRGVAGEFPLDPATVRRVGAALIHRLKETGRPGRIVLGHDTRESSGPICGSLIAGVRSAEGEAALAGIIPTPGIAFLTRAGGFDAGVVVSASHNPYRDNGIKVFQEDGTKLPDPEEERIEAMVLDGTEPVGPRRAAGSLDDADTIPPDERLLEEYLADLLGLLRGRVDLRGARIVIDCANGASSFLAGRLFDAVGVEATLLSASPDGSNINQDCGSLHPERMAETVRRIGADLGFAFDGDADRCLAADDTGRVLDGDFILYLTALDLDRRGLLRNRALVGTVMTNLWLEQRLATEGIHLLRTPVGDKYVLEEMVRGDHCLGGEQSGHIIFRDHSTTGDGLLTALMLLRTWKSAGRPLSELVAGVTPCPQVLLNVRVREKPDLASHPALGPVLLRAEGVLAGRGRLLVRYSGTEPLARVMTEGTDASEIRRVAEEVAEALRAHLS